MESRLGNTQAARDLYKKAAELCPEDAQLLQLWAIMEMDTHNAPVAEQLLRKALELAPSDSRAIQVYSFALPPSQLGGPSSIPAHDGWPLRVAASAHMNDWGGDTQHPKENASRGTQSKRPHGEADGRGQVNRRPANHLINIEFGMQMLARLLAKRGRRDEARELFRSGVQGAPTDPWLYQAWASQELSWGDPAEASRICQAGHDACAPNGRLLNIWAHAQVCMHSAFYRLLPFPPMMRPHQISLNPTLTWVLVLMEVSSHGCIV